MPSTDVISVLGGCARESSKGSDSCFVMCRRALFFLGKNAGVQIYEKKLVNQSCS